jgi:hypothetical protein
VLAAVLALAFGVLGIAQVPQGPPLTRVATPIAFVDLVYPPVARSGRVDGAVVVDVSIDERGFVEAASATSGPVVLMTVSAENARRWKFAAGSKQTISLVYIFDIEGFCAAGSAPTLTRVVPPFNVVKVTTCHDWQP